MNLNFVVDMARGVGVYSLLVVLASIWLPDQVFSARTPRNTMLITGVVGILLAAILSTIFATRS